MKSVLCRPVHVLLEGGFSNFSERLKAAVLRLLAIRRTHSGPREFCGRSRDQRFLFLPRINLVYGYRKCNRHVSPLRKQPVLFCCVQVFRCGAEPMEKPSSSGKAALEERRGLVEDSWVLRGAGGEVDPQTPRKSSSSRSSRKSFRLDYRLEEEVTKSCRDKNGRWTNPWPTWRFPSYTTLLRFLLLDKNHSNALDNELPVLEPYFIQTPDLSESGPGLRVTWLGHATVLVEMTGLNILTDPMFSQRASPFQFMGHKRFVPLGLMDWLVKTGCENVMELDWWEENCVPGHDDVTFVCTPSQHWSKRTALDNNKSLWSSWSILGPDHRFFFAGDTGYCSSFQEIGRRFGPFDLAAIPIGAYLPRDMMRGQHVDPEEAVQVHQDLQAKQSVAIHWGTFALAYEFYLEPPVRLREALEQKGLKPDSFFTLHHGESRLLSPRKMFLTDPLCI
ncbi:hypothetical protein F7725_021570 [Dissostichus mawsoni]|uniref:Metallo-beta-lactamase domain-containing protein n=1 Tax=Dissostichus mawsoni TaxID=36200 RepID=A0A7J5ZDH7_DISMA|nr:hypothetical protein F7725_021570 [Dissostichus mawsoni]